MEKNNLITQLLQLISTATAILVPISQFIFREQFKSFFNADEKIFTSASVTSFVLSIVIILALYSNRYLVSFKKYYPNKKAEKRYYAYLRTLNTQNDATQVQISEIVLEPFSFTLEKIATFFIILSFVWFYLFISSESIHIIGLSYVLLIISVVFSASVFAIKLHLESDYKTRQINSNQAVVTKIKEYLAGDIKIRFQYNDNKNVVFPIRHFIVERGSDIYKVAVNPNDPESYFSIEKQPQIS
ncbi:MAG: hypothetical protein PHF35_04275 [Candidatus Moranbacteria bacterium]|nr:hypothetical protein [Candidatus Moranbacteria bacterium]